MRFLFSYAFFLDYYKYNKTLKLMILIYEHTGIKLHALK